MDAVVIKTDGTPLFVSEMFPNAAEQHVVTVSANPPSFLIGDINHKEARLARNHGPPVAKRDRWRSHRRA